MHTRTNPSTHSSICQVSRLIHHSRRTEEDDGGPPDGGSGADQRLSWSAHGLRDTTGRTGTYRYMAPEVRGLDGACAAAASASDGCAATGGICKAWTRTARGRRTACGAPLQAGRAPAASPEVRSDFEGTWTARRWHGLQSRAQGPRRRRENVRASRGDYLCGKPRASDYHGRAADRAGAALPSPFLRTERGGVCAQSV